MRPVDQLLRATAQAEARHFWFRGFRRFVAPLLRVAAEGHPRPEILDCGCGTGANVEWLSTFGRASGFDLTASGLEIGRSMGRTTLVQATVAAAPFGDHTFDIVTSFDVLYSLEPPVERLAVAEMFRVLRPGGWLIVNVAAMESLRGDHSVLSHELRRYSRATLSSLLSQAGFEIRRITYTNASLFLPMLAARTWQRLRGLSPDDRAAEAKREIEVPPAPLNALLDGLLWLESQWLRAGSNPVGSSLLCLARKPA
jgi:SAM-dependent methyltransferase